MEKEGLFRKKAMESITAPEQLNDYIRVAGPSIWMLLAAVVALLAAVGIWSVMGRIETSTTVTAVAEDGRVVCYVPEGDAGIVQAGMTVRIDGEEYTLGALPERPVQVDEDSFDAYTLHVSGLEVGSWTYETELSAQLPDGVYEAHIVTDSVLPLTFLLN